MTRFGSHTNAGARSAAHGPPCVGAIACLCVGVWASPRTALAQIEPAVASVTPSRVPTPPATPPDEAALREARRHFELGLALHDQHNLDGALAEFQRAYELSGRATVLFNISSTLQALHRYANAIRSLRVFLSLPGSTPAQRRAAQGSLTQLEALVARVQVETVPANTPYTVDGRAPDIENGALVLGPGTHAVEASREGYRTARVELTVAAGESRALRIPLEQNPVVVPYVPPAPTPVVPQPTLAIAGAPTDAVLFVDDVRRSMQDPLTLREGEYRVRVTAPGAHPWSDRLRLLDGHAHTVHLHLAPEGMHPAGFGVSLGLSVAALAVGAVTGGLCLGQYSAWERDLRTYDSESAAFTQSLQARIAANPQYTVTEADEAEHDRLVAADASLRRRVAPMQTLATAATATSIVGVAGLVVATVLGVRTEFSPRRSTATSRAVVIPVPAVAPGAAGGGPGVAVVAPF